MKALVFTFSWTRFAIAKGLGLFSPRGYLLRPGPIALKEVPEPRLPADDWVLINTRLAGICGSDLKQVFLGGAIDNPLTSLMSFPHVMGHEVVGEVVEVGKAVTRLKVGDRVACSPWLACAARGLPPCPACQVGRFNVCQNFTEGAFAPGMHYGTCSDISGGFAPLLPAHEGMCFVLPEEVSFEQAVQADPFAVMLEALLKSPPRAGETVLVFGCGPLGILGVHMLQQLYPAVKVLAVDRHEHLRTRVEAMGATYFSGMNGLVEAVAEVTKAKVHKPMCGPPWLMTGVDHVYDTVGSAKTIEIALRVVKPRGSVVLIGVSAPARFEWTPLFFKEIALIGTCGCGLAEFEGKPAHAVQLFLDLLAAGRIDPAQFLTHTFPLSSYQDAFVTALDKRRHQSLKVTFDLTQTSG